MSDRTEVCLKCSAGIVYLVQEHLGRLQIFSCRRCGATAFVSPGEPPGAEAERTRLGRRNRSLSGKTAGELRLVRSAQADLLDHDATNAFVAGGPREEAAAAIGMTERRAHSRRQRHRERYGLGPKKGTVWGLKRSA